MLNCSQCNRDKKGMEWPGRKCTDCYQNPVPRHIYTDKNRTEPDSEYYERAILRVAIAKLEKLSCGTCGEKVIGHNDSHSVT
jgi:hypothetical protein